jgi:Protein of unknown function (DUF2934)
MPVKNPSTERMPTAHSLQEAARTDNSLEGYAAINYTSGPHHDQDRSEHELIAELAYHLYLQRKGQPGSAEEDWLRAEREVRTRREAANPDAPTVPGDAMNL